MKVLNCCIALALFALPAVGLCDPPPGDNPPPPGENPPPSPNCTREESKVASITKRKISAEAAVVKLGELKTKTIERKDSKLAKVLAKITEVNTFLAEGSPFLTDLAAVTQACAAEIDSADRLARSNQRKACRLQKKGDRTKAKLVAALPKLNQAKSNTEATWATKIGRIDTRITTANQKVTDVSAELSEANTALTQCQNPPEENPEGNPDGNPGIAQ